MEKQGNEACEPHIKETRADVAKRRSASPLHSYTILSPQSMEGE